MTADFKVFNVYLDGYGEEQRKYVGDIRDVQSISVKDFGGVSAERLQQISKGRFNGAVTVFPDEKREVPMAPNAPNFRRKVSLFSLKPVLSASVLLGRCLRTPARLLVPECIVALCHYAQFSLGR